MSSQRSDKASEREPLVQGTPEQRVFQLSKYVNANSPWYLFVSNVALVATTIIAVLPATAFVTRNYHQFMPHCYDFGNVHEVLCSTFTFSFWSYPIICPLMAGIIVRRRLLETRLYYESFLNGIHVDIVEDPVANPMVGILLVWGMSAIGVVLYVTEPFPLTAKAQYFLPIATFIIFVFSNWNINSYLITLPDFAATDPEYARDMFDKAIRTYVSEPQMRVAFENCNDELDGPTRMSSSTLSVRTMTSAQFFGKLRDECEKEVMKFDPKPLDQSGSTARVAGCFGLVSRPPWIERYPRISRPEVMSTWFSLRKGFWVYRILFNTHLSDARSTSFGRWFTAFTLFVWLEGLMCVIALCHALSLFLVYERYSPPNSTLVWVLGCFGFGDKAVSVEMSG